MRKRPHSCGLWVYMRCHGNDRVAETEGFEPSVQMYPYDGLANRWFQPLTHVSGSQQRGHAIARGSGVGKRRAALFPA